MASDRQNSVSIRKRVREFVRGTAAGPIVEFAIIVPVLLLLVFGIVDFARAFLERNKIVAGARIGARSAAVMPPSFICDEQATAKAKIQDNVRAYFTDIDPQRTPPAVADIVVTPYPFDFCDPGSVVAPNITVTIQNYSFNAVTPLLGMLGRDLINLQAKATYRWEYSP